METRRAKIIVNNSGGTASRQGKTYRVTIPNSWINRLGGIDSRELELSFDGSCITLRQPRSISEYISENKAHRLLRLKLYNKDKLCTTVIADYTGETVLIENHTDNPLYTAFGVKTNPSWQDYLSFLEERCVPKTRAGLQKYLNAIGVGEYDPLSIIRKTEGRMAEDNQWLEVTEL